MSFDSVGSWASRLGTQPVIFDPIDEADQVRTKPRPNPWPVTDTIEFRAPKAAEAAADSQKMTILRGIGKGLTYALGAAAASYGLGTLFTWASQMVPTIFARSLLGAGTALKFVGKVIPASLAFVIESIFYTFPKWLFTQGIPTGLRYSWDAISVVGIALGKAASWVGRNVLSPVLDTTWKVISTVGTVIGDGALWLGKNIVHPGAKFIWKNISKAAKTIENIAIWMGENLFLPLIEYTKIAVISISKVFNKTAEWLGKNILNPALRIAVKVVSSIGNALYVAGTKILEKAIPLMQYTWKGLSAAAEALNTAGQWIATRIVIPALRFAWKGISASANVIHKASQWFSNVVLTPIIRVTVQLASGAMKMANQALSWIGSRILNPIFNASATLLKYITNGAGQALGWMYRNLLTPGFNALASGSRYIGQFIGQMAKGFGKASAAVGKGISSAFQSARKEVGNLIGWFRGLFARTA